MSVISVLLLALLPGQLVPGGKSEPIDREVRRNVLAQPVGPVTVAALNLDDAFLNRVVGRVIRASYRERYHRLAAVAPPPPIRAPQATELPAAVRIVRVSWPRAVLAARTSVRPDRPALRGLRAAILGETAIDEPGDSALTKLIAEHLSTDGALMTLARVCERATSGQALAPASLRRCGFPVDLLAHFGDGRDATLAAIREAVSAAGSAAAARAAVEALPFRWRPTLPGFEAASESGERHIGALRLQVNNMTLASTVGAGGGLDLHRQLLALFPDLPCTVTINERLSETYGRYLSAWAGAHSAPVTVYTSALPVMQWAQDNGKPGVMPIDGTPRHATLLPRYANQREEAALYMPNESFVMDDLAERGWRCGHSPLLFQGGNILIATHPGTGARIGLIGEAEIYRNLALGLGRAQVEQAFRSELTLERLVVIPAVGIHIDTEITVRACGDRLVAFVNDPDAAARIIVEQGLDALGRAGLVDAETASQLTAAMDAQDRQTVATLMDAALARLNSTPELARRLADAFSQGPADFGAGNVLAFLTALDTYAMDVQRTLAEPRHGAAYVESLRARRIDRRALHTVLAEAGFDVVQVPGLSDYRRGIAYLNGVHEPQRYLMPTWGGLYAPLDAAAAGAFRASLGSAVKVVGVLSAQSQREGGALHCSIAVYPAPAP